MTALFSNSRRAISKRMQKKIYDTEFAESAGRGRRSVVIALLADRKRDGEAVSGRRQRASRVGSVGARRIFEAIEIEHEFAGFIEAVGGEAGVEKTASAVSGGGAGHVAKNEEEFCHGGIFKNGLQPKCFSREAEFRGAGNGLIVVGADKSGERDGLVRREGDPSGDHAKSGIGLEPLESVKAGDGGRIGILDAKSETRLAANHVHVESADGEMGRKFILIRFGSQSLRFCGPAGDEKVGRESSRGRIQRDGFAFEAKDGEVSGSGGEMDLVVGSGADGIVSELKPLEADEREPTVGLEEVGLVLFAPGSVVFLPGRLLRGCRSGQREQKNDEKQASRTIPEAHEKSISCKRKGWKLGLGITPSELDCLQ